MTMAINSNIVVDDKNPVRSLCSSKTSNLSSCRLIKINFAGKDNCSSSKSHGLNGNRNIKSPYFTNDKVQVLSRVTAKKVTNKTPNEFTSSFPLATSVYKANSDEFRLKKRGNHKVKKSVLTLPNEPAPMPKTYTVSDLNDSEYFNAVNDSNANKSKKRRSVKRVKKCRLKEPTMEFYDRDARYCSQLNIDLDCSSSEIVNINGDGERISKMSYKSNNSMKAGNYANDVWAVLRNINKLRFRDSPPDSQQSVVPLRKRRPIIRKNNDGHFFETCRTEEFAYISSFDFDGKGRDSCSPSSSFDRVTVIGKQSEQDEIMQEFRRNILEPSQNIGDKAKNNLNNQVQGRKKRHLKQSNKKELRTKKKIENNLALEYNTRNKSPQHEKEKPAAENNKSALQDNVSKTSSLSKRTEAFSDYSSIKENDSASNEQTNNLKKGVQSNDAYKLNNVKSLPKSPKTKVQDIKPIGDTDNQLNGITKVILNKERQIISNISPTLLAAQRKPRLALTLPNSNVSKLSRVEIKRRLANQKFPIVILGKDQLTNRGIYVASVEGIPQFEGLDKHVWPFMLEWSEEKRTVNTQDGHQKEIVKAKNPKLKNKTNHRGNIVTNANVTSNLPVSKKVESKKKKNNTVPITNGNTQLATEASPHVVQKPKPLTHFKNKMFNFLQKNSTFPKYNQEPEIVQKDKQVGTNETSNNYNTLDNKLLEALTGVLTKEVTNKPIENRIVPKPFSPVRHPWAKGKWASDFIENIIKKIRTGVYYGVDRKDIPPKTNANEVSTQTQMNTSKNACVQNGDDFILELNTMNKKDSLQNIPGFDQSLATLEIETISTNKIAVKHCVTNVVVHFDIQILGETNNMIHTQKSMSCIPMEVTDNQEKVFKCNTCITNSILPAELCSIIPTMMQKLLNSEKELLVQPMAMENVQPFGLKPMPAMIEPQSTKLSINSILPGSIYSDKIRPFLLGQFQTGHLNCKTIKPDLHYPIETINNAAILIPKVNTQIICHYNSPSLNLNIIIKTSNMTNTLTEKTEENVNRSHINCMALQLYEPKKWSVVPVGTFNTTEFINQIVDRINVNEFKKFKILSNELTCHSINIAIYMPLLIPRDENQNGLSTPLSNNKVGVISLFNAFKKNICNKSENSVQVSNTIESNNEPKREKPRAPFDESKSGSRKRGPSIKMLRRKGYVRFYRKCNSMSSISNYKSTPLNRVTNLEEFCQVLGSNVFCNVLDGCLEKKIVSAIEEMKNWISEINPKQALLILLLTNKKDTPNLIRFRPVLLQGIAVNRITKADELDTEIEVIERENFKLPQYEGISYLPASSKNQDNLFEELCWIAKTTASDYQKTFDESSEKLLKSLLEKRKKLNPSYLRVMARYVGLGLLAPTKL